MPSSHCCALGTRLRIEAKVGVGMPIPLFETPAGTIVSDVTPDCKRFLLVTPVGPSASAPFTVVLNWTTALN
jgi:hypothetical protein